MELIEKIEFIAIAHRVLAVAVIKYRQDGILFDWACYVDSVRGNNHMLESQEVGKTGDKQSISISIFLFPHLDKNKYRL